VDILAWCSFWVVFRPVRETAACWDQVYSVNGETDFPGPVNGGGKVPQPVGRT